MATPEAVAVCPTLQQALNANNVSEVRAAGSGREVADVSTGSFSPSTGAAAARPKPEIGGVHTSHKRLDMSEKPSSSSSSQEMGGNWMDE